MRFRMPFTAQWPAFGITGETAEKLMKTRPASIDRYLKKDKEPLRFTANFIYEGKRVAG
jgi:hypothetical protein